MRRLVLLPLLFLLLAAAPGCVRRGLVVESEPPGAEVWIDGDPAGLTPVRLSFSHYGAREIVLSKGGYALVKRLQDIQAPWYERFPIDFLTENLWPGTLVDERYFVYTLQPLPPEQADPDKVYERAKAMQEP